MQIYPTRRAIVVAAAGAPAALAVGLVAPGWWILAAAWMMMVAALMGADLLLAARPSGMALAIEAPTLIGMGRGGEAEVSAVFGRGAPRNVELAVGPGERLAARPIRQVIPVAQGRATARVSLTALRRGEGRLERLWARWTGPLGLVWLQTSSTLNRAVLATPDIQGVKEQALRLFSRDAPFGQKAQIETGEGADFHALREFQTGMDVRAIDWKQSARHGKLVGREFRTERNHHIVLALDSGRLMSAPIDGVPRIDHAINAALLLAFVSLKMGDRAGLFAFDSRPRTASGVAAGPEAFPLIQKLAAQIDYSTEETNFTLALATLSARLERRSLIVVFTDFVDPTSAQLMLESLGRLMRTHLVLFVVFRDEALEDVRAREPAEADDIARAVMADQLLRQREAVVNRLRRMGAQIVEAPARALGPALVDRYLHVKRRELV